MSDRFLSPPHTDYETSDDYAPGGANWVDVSRIGSNFQEEVDTNRSGHYRHRDRGRVSPWVCGIAPETLNLGRTL